MVSLDLHVMNTLIKIPNAVSLQYRLDIFYAQLIVIFIHVGLL